MDGDVACHFVHRSLNHIIKVKISGEDASIYKVIVQLPCVKHLPCVVG